MIIKDVQFKKKGNEYYFDSCLRLEPRSFCLCKTNVKVDGGFLHIDPRLKALGLIGMIQRDYFSKDDHIMLFIGNASDYTYMSKQGDFFAEVEPMRAVEEMPIPATITKEKLEESIPVLDVFDDEKPKEKAVKVVKKEKRPYKKSEKWHSSRKK